MTVLDFKTVAVNAQSHLDEAAHTGSPADATRVLEASPLVRRFEPIFARIAETAVDREQNRTLAYEPVKWLRDAGYTVLRVPKRFGGEGVSLQQFFELVTRLGEADSNLPQILRVHAVFIEALLEQGDEALQRRWFKEIVDGKIFAGAVSERTGETKNSVRLTRNGSGWQLDGEKFYTTGSLYADWIDVTTNDGETDVRVLVEATAPGLQRVDDWDGFGQRLTSSGTIRFDAVQVSADHIYRRFDNTQPRRHSLQTSFVQHIHLANLAGITRAILRDTVEFTRARTRTFGVAGQSNPSDNPLVQRVIGRLASIAYSTLSISQNVSRTLDEVAAARAAGNTSDHTYFQLETQVFQAQQIIIEQTLEAATLMFEVGGATATSESRRFDRHWRNARTLASHNPATLREAAIGRFYLTGEGQQERFNVKADSLRDTADSGQASGSAFASASTVTSGKHVPTAS